VFDLFCNPFEWGNAVAKIKEFLSETGSWIIGLGVLILFLIILALIFKGVTHVSILILPWIHKASIITSIIFVVFLIPFSLFQKTKPLAGNGMLFSSYIFGLNAWLLGFLYTLSIWGWIALFIGISLAGVGVVPIGILALAIKGKWIDCLFLVVLIVFVYGTRGWGLFLIEISENTSSKSTKIIRWIIIPLCIFIGLFMGKGLSNNLASEYFYIMNAPKRTDITLETHLVRLATMIREKYELPIMIEDGMQLLDVRAEDNSLVYNYEFTNIFSEDMIGHKGFDSFFSEQKAFLTSEVCNTSLLQFVLNKGATAVYKYFGKNGKLIGSISIAQSDCDD
jgi:hypothetical protein